MEQTALAADKKVIIPEVADLPDTIGAPQPNFLDTIERLASNPAVDVEKIQRIMDMQEQIITREAKRAYNDAMFRAQQKMPIVGKKESNTQTHSKYAGYDEILKQCQPIYTAEGLSVTFYQGHGTTEDPLKEGHNRIMADVMHKDGYTKTFHADIPVETTGAKGGVLMTLTHATGSAFSYGRSYLMRLIFNIPTGDDDNGNGAGGVITYISDKELHTITDMILAKEANQAKFLEYMGVDLLEHIKSSDFKKAMEALRAKLTPEQIKEKEAAKLKAGDKK
jgi:hypothetical protein